MQKGINLYHPETGQDLGKSKKAAHRAVIDTAISRIFLNVTIFLPPLALVAIEGMHLMPKGFKAKTAVEAILISAELYLAVPTGIAMFPQ